MNFVRAFFLSARTEAHSPSPPTDRSLKLGLKCFLLAFLSYECRSRPPDLCRLSRVYKTFTFLSFPLNWGRGKPKSQLGWEGGVWVGQRVFFSQVPKLPIIPNPSIPIRFPHFTYFTNLSSLFPHKPQAGEEGHKLSGGESWDGGGGAEFRGIETRSLSLWRPPIGESMGKWKMIDLDQSTTHLGILSIFYSANLYLSSQINLWTL